MPPAIQIMRQRPRADFTEAVELGYIFNSNDYITHFLTELTEFQNFTQYTIQLGVSVHFLSFLQNSLLRNTIPFELGLDIWDFVENPADCLRVHQSTSLLQNVLGFPYSDFFRSRRGEKMRGLAQWNRKSRTGFYLPTGKTSANRTRRGFFSWRPFKSANNFSRSN
jgi:hypothetical protein